MNNFTLGINEYGLLEKLVSLPREEVWKAVKERGITSIEVCTLFDGSEAAKEKLAQVEQKYQNPLLKAIPKGSQVMNEVAGIREAGLSVVSCHLMFGNMYPDYVLDTIPYMKEITEKTGIRQFVISCLFDSKEMVEEYLPKLSEAATAMKECGCVLCYHDHDMDCIPLEGGKSAMEMLADGAPDLKFQLDIGWAWYGKFDTLKFMEDYKDRVISLHLKDFTKDARERTDIGRFTAIGSGAVNTAECLRKSEILNLEPERLIIDQDRTEGDVYDDVASGVQFVKSVLS